MLVLLVAAAVTLAAMTNSATQIVKDTSYITSQHKSLNPVYKFCKEIEGDIEGWVLDGSTLIFEGSTADAYESTITATDPTADNAITLPDDSGAVAYQPTGTVAKDETDGAIPVTASIVTCTTDATASAWTLANGENGQLLVVTLATGGGGVGTITPTTATGWVTAKLGVAGETVTLMYVDDTVGWVVIGTASTDADVLPVITIS